MTRLARRAALATVALLSLPPLAGAQPSSDAPMRLTLDDAIRRSLEASHRIGEAVARGDATAAAVGIRHAATLPQVAAQAGYTRTNHVDVFGVPLLSTNQLRIIYPDVPDNYRTRLDLQWPIYTGGRLDALERAARFEATASADEIATTRIDLTLEVTRAYWALVTGTEALRVVQEAVARADAHLRDVRNQLDVGLVPPSDVSRRGAGSRQRRRRSRRRSCAQSPKPSSPDSWAPRQGRLWSRRHRPCRRPCRPLRSTPWSTLRVSSAPNGPRS